MTQELIVVKQLPIIEQQLLQVKAHIEKKVASALSLACTEDTVKVVKKVRTELNNDFNALEEKRIKVKKAILSPYEQFESIYHECVSDLFKPADQQLKEKIDEVENALKEKLRLDAVTFFNEYAASKEIDFVVFDQTGINVTLSVSKKSLKDQGRLFIDKVVEELALISTQEYQAEILVEYKKTLNVATAITTVAKRMKAIEAERARAIVIQKAAEERAAAVRNIDTIVETERPAEPLPAPVALPDVQPDGCVVQSDKHITVTFSVTDTRERLISLREFLKNGGYNYVSQ